MFLRLPRKRTDALTRHDTSHSHWKDVLQLALLDGQCYLLRITRAGKLILTK